RGTIRRPDNGPLGTEEEVMVGLSNAFPGVRFQYEAAEAPAAAAAYRNLSWFSRLWLTIFGTDVAYPRRYGFFESGTGGSVEFYFHAEQPVRWITATSYGRTAGLDVNFDRLYAATGWKVFYGLF
ncbi:MAG TPA: hypothetical protein VGH70_17660, partial [Bradyrhizobium sp.]